MPSHVPRHGESRAGQAWPSHAGGIARAFTVESGCLDVVALDHALGAVIARHAALRSTIGNGSDPLGAGGPARASALTVERCPAADLGELLARGAADRLGPENGQLLGATLFVPDAGMPVLLVAAHRSAADLVSFAIVLRELHEQYAALIGDRAVDLQAPAPSIGRAPSEADHAFWLATLAGELPVVELPDLRRRPARPAGEGARWRQDLGASRAGAVRELAGARTSTSALVLLTALQSVLHRYTGLPTLLVGAPLADREHSSASVVGPLTDTVVLRADITRDTTFAALLTENARTLAAAGDHRRYPLALLDTELRARHDADRPPLVAVICETITDTDLACLALEEPDTPWCLGDVRLTSRPLPVTAPVDLTVRFAELDEQLVAVWEYDTDVLNDVTVRQLGRDLAALADDALDRPDTLLRDLAMGTTGIPAAAFTAAPGPDLIADLILARAASAPDTVAVRAGEDVLSYGELANRSGALAAHLVELGAGPEARVGVHLPPSTDAIVAILAVLRAGAAYVPLDPAGPVERAAHILHDAGAALLITRDGLRRMPTHIPIIDLASWEAPDLPWPRLHRPDPRNLAYVMYTSGSTGTPKGVGITHANLLHSTHARTLWFPEPVETFLLISSLGFDSSVAGLFWTLHDGGTLVLPETGREQDPAHHRDLLAAHGVSHFESVPSLYLELLQLLEPGDLPLLRSVVVAGEACPRTVYQRHHEIAPAAAFVNEYGPTEATVWCSAHRASPDPGPDRPQVAIGTAIPHAALHLLDGYGNRTPAGVIGELFVGGPLIARGYLGRPGSTAERFLPDPFADEPGARMYRTGDLARQLPDGELEFVGRADRQLKIHGVRIELDEIETALRSCPGVADTAVRPVARPSGDLALVAYLVAPDGEAALPSTTLRDHLLDRVLTAMVPAAYCWLPRLPLTRHGKLDPAALPDIDLGATSAPDDSANEVEKTLAGIYATILDVEDVGLDDDFFTLGGHSLLVTQLTARIRKALGVEVAMRTVFTAPTVRTLAAEIGNTDAVTAPAPAPAVVARTGDSPVSYSQQALWFLDRLWPGSYAYNIAEGIRVRGELDRHALQTALDAVVVRHEALRTTFVSSPDGPVQRVGAPTPVDVQIVECGAAVGSAEFDAQLTALARTSFDLTTGPLMRAVLLQHTAHDQVLLLLVHHILVDAWSLAILTDEVTAGYAAARDGLPDPTPAPPMQYADVARWQREHIRAELVADDLDHWIDLLAESPARRLPDDLPRPVVQSFDGRIDRWELSPEITAGLRACAARTDSTLFMVLLAAFGALLGRYSYVDDVVVGSPISGRTHEDTERLIGFFANTLPLRLDLTGELTFTGLVRRARAVCLDAYDHQEMPFELLVEELQPVRDLSRNPLFQVNFALQNAPRTTPTMPGLDLDLIDVATGAAMFELNVPMWESGDLIKGYFEYNTDLFTTEHMTAVRQAFIALLAAVATDPDRPVADLVAGGPAIAIPARQSGHVHASDVAARFDEQARLTPTATAVSGPTVSDGTDTTANYCDLAARTAERSAQLRAAGAAPGVAVGLCMPASTDWVAGLLAILSCGATCVPMDPRRPLWWREQVSTDAGTALVLGPNGIDPTSDTTDTTGLGSTDPGPGTDHPAVIAYGEDAAAGVAVSAEALLERILAAAGTAGVERGDRVVLHAPVWSEQALWVCLAAVTAGAELVVGRPHGQDGPAVDVTIEGGAAVAFGVHPPRPGAVRFVPTTALVAGSTRWAADPLGRWFGEPLPGARVAIVGLDDRLVPAGVPGHLHVCGPAVASRYHRRPDLSESGLIVAPWAPDNDPWAPTEVLARWSGDGRLEWLGPLHTAPDDLDTVPFIAPASPMERVVATAWDDVLDVSPIGTLDNFFRIGGHSLAATQVLLRVTAMLQVEIEIQAFFQNPTIAGLCDAVIAAEAVPGRAEQIAAIWARIKDRPTTHPSEAT